MISSTEVITPLDQQQLQPKQVTTLSTLELMQMVLLIIVRILVFPLQIILMVKH
jgi:hypothetical protein